MIATEWVCDHIDHSKVKLSFIFLNEGDSEIEEFVKIRGFQFLRIKYSGKKDLPEAILLTLRFFKKAKTQVIHCHLFDASIVGLLSGFIAGIKKRIYTRHYSSLHHTYFPKAVKYDRLLNFLATDIIAISEVVKSVLLEKENVDPKKLTLVHHGFLMEEYDTVSEERINTFKRKYQLQNSSPLIGVVSRYELLKGIQFVIPAFERILDDYPKAKLILANAHGRDEPIIRPQLSRLPPGSLVEVLYERDMGAFYKTLDYYIHVPINQEIEAFGQTYVEALIAGIPSIFTLSGIANEFIKDGENALVANYEDSDHIYFQIKKLLNDKALRQKLIENGKADAYKLFDLPVMIKKLETLYLN